MKSHLVTLLSLLLSITPCAFGGGSLPIKNIQVTLHGKVFYVSGATTASELQIRLQEESGLDPTEQGQVSFHGKVLGPTDSLSEAGMKDGDQANIIPNFMADHLTMLKGMGDGLLTLRQKTRNKTLSSAQERHDLAVMEKLYEDMTKSPYMHEQMEGFVEHLRNPATLDKAADSDRVESLRQIFLNNPLFLEYISKSINLDILNDPDAWYRHVQICVKRWSAMDGYELWQTLMNGNLFKGDEEPPQ